MSDTAVVIGGGIIGVAAARALALRGIEVVLLERNAQFGAELTGQNSEVGHAGAHYKPGSLKAEFCAPGNEQLFALAKERGLPHSRCEKLILANGEIEIAALEDLEARAKTNGVRGAHIIGSAEARKKERLVRCDQALFLSTSGMIDAHQFLYSLMGEAEENGATFVARTPFWSGKVLSRRGGFELKVGDSKEPDTIRCDFLVNAAGLGAPAAARKIDGIDPGGIPQEEYGFGCYASYNTTDPPARMLLYPAPVAGKGSVGIHYRANEIDRTDSYRVVIGPDIRRYDEAGLLAALRQEDPEVVVAFPDRLLDPAFEANSPHVISLVQAAQRLGSVRVADEIRFDTSPFREALHRFLDISPEISDRLALDYAGVRPKIKGKDDFDPQTHGVRGLVCAYGSESPGLTASMPYGDYLAKCALQ